MNAHPSSWPNPSTTGSPLLFSAPKLDEYFPLLRRPASPVPVGFSLMLPNDLHFLTVIVSKIVRVASRDSWEVISTWHHRLKLQWWWWKVEYCVVIVTE